MNLDFSKIDNPVASGFGVSKFPIDKTNLAGLVSSFLAVAIMLSGVLLFIWLGWGAFQYLFAGGDKENLKKARARITWALVGFIFLILAYAISGFITAIAESRPKTSFELVPTVYAYQVNLGDYLPHGIGYIVSAGDLFNRLTIPAFSIAATAVVFYFAIAAFRWISSGGNKESIAAARAMITHSIIAFLMLIFLFLVIEYLPRALGVALYVTGK